MQLKKTERRGGVQKIENRCVYYIIIIGKRYTCNNNGDINLVTLEIN